MNEDDIRAQELAKHLDREQRNFEIERHGELLRALQEIHSLSDVSEGWDLEELAGSVEEIKYILKKVG